MVWLAYNQRKDPAFIAARFWKRVKQGDGCWAWRGAKDSSGYGVFWDFETKKAHRVAYELSVGPIPQGLTLDHLCRNRSCVNPKHLEPVTSGVNTLRGGSPSAVNARKTHCNYGHALSGTNLAVYGKQRQCRACQKERKR